MMGGFSLWHSVILLLILIVGIWLPVRNSAQGRLLRLVGGAGLRPDREHRDGLDLRLRRLAATEATARASQRTAGERGPRLAAVRRLPILRRRSAGRPSNARTSHEPRREESRARLFRRPRHLGHPEVAAGDLRLRGRDLHRRSRPGRGAGAGAQEGRDARHQGDLRRGSARGVRARLRLPDVPRQRALRGAVPARHLDRAAADRQAPDRDRRQDRRRRRGPRRHRQGQRPGALRAHLLRAQAGHQGDRAVARVGPRPRAPS